MTRSNPTSPDSASFEDRLLAFVVKELLPEGARVDRDTPLLSGGLLDSMSVMRLVAYVSDSFGIEIQPADFVIENFSSIGALGTYVRRRLEASAE